MRVEPGKRRREVPEWKHVPGTAAMEQCFERMRAELRHVADADTGPNADAGPDRNAGSNTHAGTHADANTAANADTVRA